MAYLLWCVGIVAAWVGCVLAPAWLLVLRLLVLRLLGVLRCVRVLSM